MIDSGVTDIGSWHKVSDGKIIDYTWLLKTTFGNLQK